MRLRPDAYEAHDYQCPTDTKVGKVGSLNAWVVHRIQEIGCDCLVKVGSECSVDNNGWLVVGSQQSRDQDISKHNNGGLMASDGE